MLGRYSQKATIRPDRRRRTLVPRVRLTQGVKQQERDAEDPHDGKTSGDFQFRNKRKVERYDDLHVVFLPLVPVLNIPSLFFLSTFLFLSMRLCE